MSRLDEFLPEYDVRERHERRVPATPELAVAAALGIPVAPDALVRRLFRVRGLPGGGSIQSALRGIGLAPLVEEPTCIVMGAAGRPWSPRGWARGESFCMGFGRSTGRRCTARSSCYSTH